MGSEGSRGGGGGERSRWIRLAAGGLCGGGIVILGGFAYDAGRSITYMYGSLDGGYRELLILIELVIGAVLAVVLYQGVRLTADLTPPRPLVVAIALVATLSLGFAGAKAGAAIFERDQGREAVSGLSAASIPPS